MRAIQIVSYEYCESNGLELSTSENNPGYTQEWSFVLKLKQLDGF